MSQSLRAVILSPDREMAQYIHRVLADLGGLAVVRILESYPDQIELARVLRSHAPQILFLDILDPARATGISAHVEQVMPGIQVVAVGRSSEPETLMAIMRAGIREFLAAPFERGCLTDCVARVAEHLSRKPVSFQATDLLYSFLPAKPGVGATTLAVNSSLALGRAQDGNPLLLDFDLNCGMTRFMLKLNGSYSIMDAAEHAATMDEELWPQIATRVGNLDVVHAGALNPDLRIQTLQIRHLLEYTRRNYKVVCIDLSGNLEKYSMEIMHESKKIFLVCTPEISALHLAREKLQYLQRMDLGDRVRLLLNRHTKRASISPQEVEAVVGAPVMLTLPNDYQRVARAIHEGGAIDPASELGKSCSELAAHMLDTKSRPQSENRRRFVEYFNISPARFSLERTRS